MAGRHQIPPKLEFQEVVSHPCGHEELSSGPLQKQDAESSSQALLATPLRGRQDIQFNEVAIVNSEN